MQQNQFTALRALKSKDTDVQKTEGKKPRKRIGEPLKRDYETISEARNHLGLIDVNPLFQ